MIRRFLGRWSRSLYIQIFLSFLLTCILFFAGLALFWNSYFTDFFYKDKKELLVSRSAEVVKLLPSYEDGTVSNREMRFGTRIIARGFNGMIWLVDAKGNVLSGSSEREGLALPSELQQLFSDGLKGGSGFYAATLKIEPFPAGGGGGAGGRSGPAAPGTSTGNGAAAGGEQASSAGGTGTLRNGAAEGGASAIPVPPNPLGLGGPADESLLVYYTPAELHGERIVILMLMPALEVSEALSAVRLNILVPLLFSMIAVGAILFILSRKLAGPLQRMNRAALEVAEGDFTTRVPVTSRDEVGELAHSFNFMVDQLQQWEDTRQEFLAHISHELRSPLTSLRGLIGAMNDGIIPPDKVAHYLRICDGEVQRLQRLVNDLLDLARIQNGSDVFRLRPVVLSAHLLETLELIRPAAEEKGIRLRMPELSPAASALMCDLDPDRFSQVLLNLLYNAIRFTPEGGTLTVELAAEGEEAVVYVKDTGIGMSEEELSRIWDRFYKADASRTGGTEGTGLGLTIVKHLVGGMNGHITVESEPGAGTVFRVAFPLRTGEGRKTGGGEPS
ncbi:MULTISPECIES: sensor histidine kinase [Paenibacillus]|uniref:sensor histidine kinase n=1 Tax=Paenibacillus TaxID=44249 RepID=UPI0022B88048|nr:HAMP domain-containing sensor histidine kinase [Paenibacillus caseinilyticus]MCZ8521450.1 HAMP domain-containing sensor histidine kinase [Paenibacillus caseinilyticus]